MAHQYGHDVLSVFDVWEESRDFLSQLVTSRAAPGEELSSLFQQSLLGGSEDWNYLIECATSIRHSNQGIQHELDGHDILAYVWYIFEGLDNFEESQSWEQTDRLIALAKELETDIEIHPPQRYLPPRASHDPVPRSASPKRRKRSITSHYWGGEQEVAATHAPTTWNVGNPAAAAAATFANTSPSSGGTVEALTLRAEPSTDVHNLQPSLPLTLAQTVPVHAEYWANSGSHSPGKSVSSRRAFTSPYFCSTAPEKQNDGPKRPPRGTVSGLPFPPLTSPAFGIVQEKLAHEPFWLLIAITFLIRTKGTQAIPIFYKVKERFQSPAHVADPAIRDELVDMIRHLGLSAVRVQYMQRYARAFLEDPPRAGVKHKVKNYYGKTEGQAGNLDGAAQVEPEAWEIGHMTSGKYAIDSWRIFCRDELLGEAQDWNGKGREPEFQPEWMRTRPDDKELRAYLRWMWMREGWEWDPVTGERTVLREEMQRAVNEGRVGYDDTGCLQILPEALHT